MTANETAAIDEAWSKADPAATAAAGYRAVLGYCSRDLTKILDAHWRAAYRAAGLCVGLVFEDGADRALGGVAAGAADGALADQQADAAGYDLAAALLFAVDFDATAAHIAGPIHDYAMAFDQATKRPAGVYGGIDVVDGLVTPGVRPVRYGWQTAAWSRGLLSARASVLQRVGHVNWPLISGMAANGFDEDVITNPIPLDGGVLAPPGAAPVVPTPAPAPAPPPAFDPTAWLLGWTAQQGDSGHVFELLQQWGNATFPAYCAIAPTAAVYGPQTVRFLATLAHRAASDPALAPWAGRLAAADGANIAAGLSHALARYGFAVFLAQHGFTG